jgi:hypothetical protein
VQHVFCKQQCFRVVIAYDLSILAYVGKTRNSTELIDAHGKPLKQIRQETLDLKYQNQADDSIVKNSEMTISTTCKILPSNQVVVCEDTSSRRIGLCRPTAHSPSVKAAPDGGDLPAQQFGSTLNECLAL